MIPMPRSLTKPVLGLSLIFFLAMPAHSAGVDVYAGFFDFSAKTESLSGAKSGLGAYKLSFLFPIGDRFEIGIGYSLLLADTFSGDAAFGIDAEAYWFPLTSSGAVSLSTENTQVMSSEIWRPFLGLSYNVRQFQSVETQYNGFGLGVGVERALRGGYDLKTFLRYVDLQGPNSATATEIIFLVGLSFAI